MKNLVIFIIVFLITCLFAVGINQIYAITFNGIDLGNDNDIINALNYEYFCVSENSTLYKIIFANSPIYISGDKLYPTEPSTLNYIFVNKSTLKDSDKLYNTSNTLTFGDMILANHDIYNGSNIYFSKNVITKFNLLHGKSYNLYNDVESIMFSDVYFKKSNLAMEGTVLLTDINGNLIEQQQFGINSGLDVLINIPPKQEVIMTVLYSPIYMDEYLIIKTMDYPNLTIEQNTPIYKVKGQSTVKLLGTLVPTTTPYVKSNYTTEIFYQWEDNGIIYTKSKLLIANQPFYLDNIEDYLIKFRHDVNTTISVESNFQLHNTEERISLLDDDTLAEQIIDNGGTLTENQQGNVIKDTILQTQPNKSIKITSLLEDVKDGYLNYVISPSSESQGLVEWFQDIDNTVLKYKDVQINGIINSGKQFHQQMQGNQYVVITDNNGIMTVKIPQRFKKDTHYTVEYINNYVTDTEIETEYRDRVPTVPPIENSNDYFSKPYEDNFYNWINNYNIQENYDNILKNATSTIDDLLTVTTKPIGTMFTATPELYTLILLGFALALVKFALGR